MSDKSSASAETVETSSPEHHGESTWETFKKAFPWKDMLVGFGIPKIIFHLGIAHEQMTYGAILALVWALGYCAISYFRTKRIDIFSLLAVFFIGVRSIALLVKQNPSTAFFACAIDSVVIGVIFLVTLFMKKSIIEDIVEQSSGSLIPDFVRSSPHYSPAWKYVTAAWGISNLICAGILVYLSTHQPAQLPLFDMISSWPLTIALMMFSIKFPKWYWKSRISRPSA